MEATPVTPERILALYEAKGWDSWLDGNRACTTFSRILFTTGIRDGDILACTGIYQEAIPSSLVPDFLTRALASHGENFQPRVLLIETEETHFLAFQSHLPTPHGLTDEQLDSTVEIARHSMEKVLGDFAAALADTGLFPDELITAPPAGMP